MVHYGRLLGLDVKGSGGLGHYCQTEFQRRSGEQKKDISADIVLLVECDRPTKSVRIDVRLSERYLKSNGWDSLESWQNAYEEGRYESIYGMTVRNFFGCEKWEPLSDPDEAIYALLTPREESFFREYVAGRDLMAFGGFPRVAGAGGVDASVKKGLTKFRAAILAKAGIDIKKSWQEFRRMQPINLKLGLTYPGDFQPNVDDVPKHFCRENWPQMLGALRQTYDNVNTVNGS